MAAAGPATATASIDAASERSGPARSTLVVAGACTALVLAAQIPLALGLLQPDVQYEAGHAKRVLAVNGLLALLTVAAAGWLPRRLRPLALAPGGLLAAATLGGAAAVGGHLWDFAAAGLTLAGAWWLGRTLLRALQALPLQGVFAIELTLGLGIVGLLVLLLGRTSAIAWWSAGLFVLAAGAAGLWQGAGEGWKRRAPIWEAVAGSRIGVACAGLLLLQLGWAAVWLSAPEIMYDPLYSKTYLPDLWAHSGSIGPLLTHPQLNVMGLAQVVAVPGQALGAGDVGRELQLLVWVALTATVWWWAGRRSAAGPLAALAVGIAPQLVWQSTTAFDDLVLATGAVALALAVFRTVGEGAASRDASFGVALAIGLLAGACIWLKLHLLVVTLVIVGGWLLASGPLRRLGTRLAGVLIGAVAIAGPALILRWIDTGNPVFPTYNTIFKSSHYPLFDEPYSFPFWPHAGFWDMVKLPYESVVHPFLMSEAAPEGSFGLLVAAAVIGVLIGWRQRQRRAALIVWAGLVASLIAWWVQFRYLRYAIPAGMVAVVLVVAQLREWRPGRAATVGLLAAAGLASAVYLPSAVATFWNVPGRNLPFAAAFGRWDEEDYLRTVFPEKDALEAYQRLAPAGADALSDAHERLFLRDRDLSPKWELDRLLQLSGPPPTSGDDAYRRLRALGIGWALVTGANRTADGATWLPALLAAHGEIAFSDRGWDLYRLVPRPARAADLTRITAAVQAVPVCPGKLVAVQLTAAAGSAGAQVSLNSDSGDAKAGHTAGTVPPGRTGWVYATAPPGTHAMSVMTTPPVGDAAIVRARVGTLGRCGESAR